MVTDVTPRSVFNGNDLTTSFPFSWRADSESEVILVHRDADGELTPLSSGFSVTLNADQESSPGGSISYPSSGDPLATGEKLVAYRETDPTQEVDLETLGELDLDNVESMADKLQKQLQEQKDELSRCVKFPLDETPDADDSETFITRCEEAQEAAETAEANAETAETNAETAETNAETAATAAAASAAAAAASAALLTGQVQSGLFSARPASPAGIVFYYSTDRDSLEVWIPAASRWFLIG